MPKYIDADALLAQMKDRRFYVGRRSDPICIIEDAPAVDVAPVRHGRWKFDPLAGDWICSECDLHSMEHGRFCPNCGAKNKEG